VSDGIRTAAIDPPVFRLPFRFDVERLRADVDRLVEHRGWAPYFEFHSIALRSVDGRIENHGGVRGRYADTPLFALGPYLREVADQLECEKQRIRLFRLAPGGRISEHIDYTDHTFHFGTVRTVVPVYTNPQVEMRVNGARIDMQAGECWYVDTSFHPHGVTNRGATDRVHFVIDCQVNDWLRARIPARFAAPRWRRPFDYRLARLQFAARQTSIPRALYDEGREAARIVKSPRELARRLAAWVVPPAWACPAAKSPAAGTPIDRDVGPTPSRRSRVR